MANEDVMASGLVERIGIEGSKLTHKKDGEKFVTETEMKDHRVALKLVLDELLNKEHGAISDLKEINAVGHRVVHGGEIICGLFCDKRLIPCFRRCDILASMPHSKNTPSSRFSSKYPRK